MGVRSVELAKGAYSGSADANVVEDVRRLLADVLGRWE